MLPHLRSWKNKSNFIVGAYSNPESKVFVKARGLLSIFGEENVQPTNSPLPAKPDNFRNVLLLNLELDIMPPSSFLPPHELCVL